MSLPLLAVYTTFFSMWVFTPIPIEICYGLLRDALTLLLCVLAGGMVPHHTCCSNSSDCTPFLLLMCRYTIPWHQGCTVFLWHETNSFLCVNRFWPSTRCFSVGECSPHPLWILLRVAQGCTDSSFVALRGYVSSIVIFSSNFHRLWPLFSCSFIDEIFSDVTNVFLDDD